MSVLVQYLKFLKSSPGENEKKEKTAELPGYVPSVAGSIDNEKKDEDKLTSSITDHGLASQETPKNINASSAEPVAMRSSSSAAAPAFTQPVANPGRGYNTGVPRPQTQQQPTKIPRVLERIPMANSVNDPRNGTLLDKQGSLGYSRNTGISDVEGEIYVNGSDVELLGKLGFDYSCEEYLGLEKTSEVLDVYSYIEKVAGVPKEVAKLIDAGQAFSGEYLKDMGYGVPKGYEVKGDLVCPVEKTEQAFQQDEKEKKESFEKTASRLRSNVNITKHDDPSGLTEYIASIGDRKIGNMLVADSKYKGKVVAHSWIYPDFRGMGLGKKLYGEVMRRQPEGVLHSDSVMSEDAQRVWASLNKNKGYEIAGEAPELMGRINEKALNIPNKVKKLRPAVSAVEAKGSIFDRIKKLMGIAKRAEHEKEAAEAIASPGSSTTATGSWHRSGDSLVDPKGRVMTNTPNGQPMVESPYADITQNVVLNVAGDLASRAQKLVTPTTTNVLKNVAKAAPLPIKALGWVATKQAVPAFNAAVGAADAYNRWEREDYPGASISGAGVGGDLAQLAPTPLTKGIGAGVSWASTGANAARDLHRYKNRPVEFRNTPPSISQPSAPQPTQPNVNIDIQSLAKSSEFTRFKKYFNKTAGVPAPAYKSIAKLFQPAEKINFKKIYPVEPTLPAGMAKAKWRADVAENIAQHQALSNIRKNVAAHQAAFNFNVPNAAGVDELHNVWIHPEIMNTNQLGRGLAEQNRSLANVIIENTQTGQKWSQPMYRSTGTNNEATVGHWLPTRGFGAPSEDWVNAVKTKINPEFEMPVSVDAAIPQFLNPSNQGPGGLKGPGWLGKYQFDPATQQWIVHDKGNTGKHALLPVYQRLREALGEYMANI